MSDWIIGLIVFAVFAVIGIWFALKREGHIPWREHKRWYMTLEKPWKFWDLSKSKEEGVVITEVESGKYEVVEKRSPYSGGVLGKQRFIVIKGLNVGLPEQMLRPKKQPEKEIDQVVFTLESVS